MLKLKKKLKLSPSVQIAQFAGKEDPFPKENIFYVAAWGLNFPDYHWMEAWPETLNIIRSQVYPGDCKKFYKKFIRDDVFCVGYTDQRKKTALGDEGAPFFSAETGKVYATVVNSYENMETENKKQPTLVNHIGWVRDWIMALAKQTRENEDSSKLEYCKIELGADRI